MRPEAFLLLGLFAALIALRVPISFAMGISSLVTMLAIGKDPVVTAQLIFAGMDKDSLMAIPFFVLAGAIMSQGGMARKMVDLASLLVGWMPGGLAVVNILSSMFFGAISGSAVAATSAVGSTLIPSMVERGNDRGYATAVTITGSTQGLLIPPSHNAIIFSLAAGGVAGIEALFIAGILPGVLVGLLLMTVAVTIAVSRKYKKESDLSVKVGVAQTAAVLVLGGALIFLQAKGVIGRPLAAAGVAVLAGGLLASVYFRRGKEGLVRTAVVVRDAVLPIISPVIIVGGIIFGWFTAIESSVIAVVWALIVNFLVFALLYKESSIKDYPKVAVQAMKVIVMVMWLIGNATAFGWCLTVLHVPEAITGGLLSISDDPFIQKIVVLALINLMLLALGMVMDMAPLIIITTPVLLPVAQHIGVHPVHFGMIMIANLGVGLCTPPVGSVLFVGCAIGEIKMEKVTRAVWPFYLAMLAALILITYVPDVSMFLVNAYLGK